MVTKNKMKKNITGHRNVEKEKMFVTHETKISTEAGSQKHSCIEIRKSLGKKT